MWVWRHAPEIFLGLDSLKLNLIVTSAFYHCICLHWLLYLSAWLLENLGNYEIKVKAISVVCHNNLITKYRCNGWKILKMRSSVIEGESNLSTVLLATDGIHHLSNCWKILRIRPSEIECESSIEYLSGCCIRVTDWGWAWAKCTSCPILLATLTSGNMQAQSTLWTWKATS